MATKEKIQAKIYQLRQQLLKATDQYTPSQNRMQELAQSTSPQHRLPAMETKELFTEYGSPLCLTNGQLILPQGEIGSAVAAYISERPCTTRGGEKIGSFHTHPTPPPVPSTQDLRMFNQENDLLQCIGSKIGEQPIVACYLLTTRSRAEQAGLDTFVDRQRSEGIFGSHVSADVEEVGEINAVEQRQVTPMQILDDYRGIVRDVAETHPDYSYKELIAQLKQGRIPPVLYRAFRTQYSEIDIPVYNRKGQEQLTYQGIDKMQRYFTVTIFKG